MSEWQITAEFDQAVTVPPFTDNPEPTPVVAESAEEPGAGAESRSSGLRPRGWIATCAMAAGLVLGFLLAGSSGIGGNIHDAGQVLLASGPLAQRLNNELSGRGVGPSFWTREGLFCRVFALTSGTAPGLSGIACREPAGWKIRVIAERNDGSGLPGSVTSMMANLIVGVALDAAQEEQARRQAWRPR